MNENKRFILDEDYEECRIDKLLAEINPELSRSFIQRVIDDKGVFVNNKPVKASFKPKSGDEIVFNIPEMIVPDILAEDIPLDIIYEDNDIILINKGKGMVVHPAAGNYTGTVVNALMYHCKDNLSGINGVLRPGIVHRIDKDTTGVIIACKNDNSHRFIAGQLKEHSITRRYEAVVLGLFKDSEGIIDAPIGRNPNDRKKMAINEKNGKNAVTHYKVLDVIDNRFTHLECRLETGRTHQIRVHMASIGHPLLGDTVYGPEKGYSKVFGMELQGQCLHAGILGLIHPTTHEYMEFKAELPDYFKKILEHK
ncbi:MAG: RluA family pseudouridine synthase [Lachnospiraceae bacterium]|nr:RluA family pseudouridine synthase [Lachnospiraceae bacterium]